MDVLTIAQISLPLVWPVLLAGLFLQVIPDLMRPGLFFGVTVDPRFRESELAHRIRRRYSVAIWIATLGIMALGLIAAAAATRADWAHKALAALLSHAALRRAPGLVLIAVALWAFVRANRATRPQAVRPVSVVQVELPARPEPTAWVVTAFAVPIASLAVLAFWTPVRWHEVPQRLAVHWTFNGPDRWVATTPASVAILLGLNAIVCLLLALLAWGVTHGSRHIALSGEAAQRERRFRTRVLMVLLAAQYLSIFPAWASLLELPVSYVRIWLVSWPMMLLILMMRLVLAGQGGSRGLAYSSAAPIGDRTDDRYWTWGLIYFNRSDPAFLVEKRFGVGYTFNFGHPFAWVLLMLILAIPLIGRLF